MKINFVTSPIRQRIGLLSSLHKNDAASVSLFSYKYLTHLQLFLPQLPISLSLSLSLSPSVLNCENNNVFVWEGGGEDDNAGELRRRDIRGWREGGDGVTDVKRHDRRRLCRQCNPIAQRRKPNPLTRYRVLQETRRGCFWVWGRYLLLLRQDVQQFSHCLGWRVR